MNDEKLRDLLEQLHDELEHTSSLDEKGRELLSHLSVDIQKMLGSSGTVPPTTTERFQDAIDHFEVTHPELTAALSQVLNALSNAGI